MSSSTPLHRPIDGGSVDSLPGQPNPISTSTSTSAPRSGSISLHQQITSCSHINVCRPWISWKKGGISEYVSKPRVFFDHFHHQIVLFTGSPPNKMWRSDRRTQTWMDYPINLPPHNDIIGAQFSPDLSHVALRVSDKEVKVLSTSTGEVVTARSCRGTSSRMISVHWIHDPALSKSGNKDNGLFLLFVTNAGVELYELTSDKEKGSSNSSLTTSSASVPPSSVITPGQANASAGGGVVKNKLKHVKTATYNIVYHWILLDENILLLVDAKNVFQAYKLSSKSITKLCNFELDCANTSLNPPSQFVAFHREQISLIWLYGRMVITFVNEQKGQLHLLTLTQPNSSDAVEQTHVFDLYATGKYDISNLDNVLCVHNTSTKISMMFDIRSEVKTALAEPLSIGPPLLKGSTNNLNPAKDATGQYGINYFAPTSPTASTTLTSSSTSLITTTASFSSTSQSTLTSSSITAGPSLDVRGAPGMLSLAPASFHPYVKWTFLAPSYVWESTGDQQQGNLWTLQLNLQQIAYSWPNSKRTRLVDFLLKRTSVEAKVLILQIILQIVCTEPSSLALLSRLFSLVNRMNYDHRMNPNAPISNGLNLATLPLLPPFSQPNSAASTAPPSQVQSPLPNILQPQQPTQSSQAHVHTRAASMSVSPFKPPPSFTGAKLNGRHSLGVTVTSPGPSSSSRHTISGPSGGISHQRNASGTFPVPSFDLHPPFPAPSANIGIGSAISSPSHASHPSLHTQQPQQISYDLDDSLGILSCEMLDIPALLAQPMTVEHNVHGYMLISQLDIFLHVFQRARELIPLKQLIPVVVEFLRSVHRHFLKPEDIINDLLVSLLLEDGQHYELHQFLQYHILNDSLPIANRLIASAPFYPPAYQLGIDMLYRLGKVARLTKVLLGHGQVLAAIKLLPNFKTPILEQFGLQPRDFLQVALNTQDDLTFYHTYKFFELRNLALRGSPSFIQGDGCEEFVEYFLDKFGLTTATTTNTTTASRLAGVTDVRLMKPVKYVNLGDEEDDAEDDDDIEYCGEKPSIYGQPIENTSSSSSDANLVDLNDSISSSEPIPPPTDLSVTMNIPSGVSSSSSSSNPMSLDADDEDHYTESGLGADESIIIASSQESDATINTDEGISIDGSFGGSTTVANTNGPSISIVKKKGTFQADPSM